MVIVVPPLNLYREVLSTKKPTSNINKKAWPTAAAMIQIYEKHLWGTNGALFYSGDGSHDPDIVTPYLHATLKFLSSFQKKISICDLGCGDFNIGKHMMHHTHSYTGVDIVPDLIQHNQSVFGSDQVNFTQLDIAKDDVPPADIAILRQVLQHLSNSEILEIIPKLYQYKYLILTEHLPLNVQVPNVDIISGQGIRLKKNSGVVLTAPPFNLAYKNATQWIATVLPNNKGVIRTICYEL